MSSVFQTIIIILGIVLIAALGYYLYFQHSGSSLDVFTQGVSTSPEVAAEAAEFLNRVRQLQSISLDQSLLQDSDFRSLRSYQRDVQPVSVGTSDPFSLIGDDQ